LTICCPKRSRNCLHFTRNMGLSLFSNDILFI